jgi:hypothetical protein
VPTLSVSGAVEDHLRNAISIGPSIPPPPPLPSPLLSPPKFIGADQAIVAACDIEHRHGSVAMDDGESAISSVRLSSDPQIEVPVMPVVSVGNEEAAGPECEHVQALNSGDDIVARSLVSVDSLEPQVQQFGVTSGRSSGCSKSRQRENENIDVLVKARLTDSESQADEEMEDVSVLCNVSEGSPWSPVTPNASEVPSASAPSSVLFHEGGSMGDGLSTMSEVAPSKQVVCALLPDLSHVNRERFESRRGRDFKNRHGTSVFGKCEQQAGMRGRSDSW